MRQTVPEFLDLLSALSAQGVRYVVVGGFAMVLQGATYVTFDLDLAISLESSNASAVVRALAPFNPFPPQFGSSKSFVWDERSIIGAVVSLVTDAGNIDMLRILPGLDTFEGLWSRSEPRTIYDIEVNVASIEDLIAMKQAANRPKDIDHVRQLRALKAIREAGDPGT